MSFEVLSYSFTPIFAGNLDVGCRYEAQASTGGDWGSSVRSRLYCTQNSSTSYSDYLPMTATRSSFMAQFVFPLIAGFSVTFGIKGEISGAAHATFWTIALEGVFMKK